MKRNILFFLLFLICFDFLHAGETNDSSVVKEQECITAFYFQKANIGSRYLSSVHGQDAETGYTDRHALWYDEDALRFVHVDPLSEKHPYISSYSYVLNNTIKFIDPNGMEINVSDLLKDKEHAEAVKIFAKSKEGKLFLDDYASEGQKLIYNGEVFYEEKKAGKFDKKGVDLIYKIGKSREGSQTSGAIINPKDFILVIDIAKSGFGSQNSIKSIIWNFNGSLIKVDPLTGRLKYK